jgi:hypothetical protein
MEELQETAARTAESRKRRYPVLDELLPPLDRVIMTHLGASDPRHLARPRSWSGFTTVIGGGKQPKPPQCNCTTRDIGSYSGCGEKKTTRVPLSTGISGRTRVDRAMPAAVEPEK